MFFVDMDAYRLVNRILAAALAVLAAAALARHYAGCDTSCWARLVYGRECVLCGCTRDFAGLLRGEAPWRNAWSAFFFAAYALEWLWRAAGAFVCFSRRVAAADILVHAAAGAVFMFFNVKTLLRP